MQKTKKAVAGIIAIVVFAILLLLFVKKPGSLSLRPTVNANASGRFFVGPIGSPLNKSFIFSLSNLSQQLQLVGEEQLNGRFIFINQSPGFYALIFGNGSELDYDIVPLPVANATPLVADGKPIIVLLSAQGCPFCAGMRWPLAIALSRFGNFTALYYDRSATNDYNVPTFLFNFSEGQFYNATRGSPVYGGEAPYGDAFPTALSQGAYYSSPYLIFKPFEEMGSSFFINATGLEQLNSTIYTEVYKQGNLQMNGVPYGFGIKRFSIGGVPFFDIGNRFVFDGAIINASTYLSSKGIKEFSTQASMLNSIRHPSPNSFGETTLGAANLLTVDICIVLNNTAPVCKLGYISQLEQKVKALNYSFA